MADDPVLDVEIQRESQARDLERAIAALAERQDGVVSRGQLMDLGIGPGAIDHRVRLGRLHNLYRAVCAVGQRRLPREARWLAGVLAVGPGTVLSHRPAGAHWQIIRWSGTCEVTIARPGVRSREGLRVHEGVLPPDEVTTLAGIPITTVPRTLFDLAAVLPERRLERALNETEVLKLWDELSLDRLLHRYPRRRGASAIRAVLGKRSAGATLTRSDLEELFLELVDRNGLPRPEINALIEGFEVDAVWRDARVVVELDARSTHATTQAFERDRERDRILHVAGWRPIRVTAKQLATDRHSLVAAFHELLSAATV